MELTKFQYNIIKRERKDLVLIDVPDIDDVIVEFLKLNGVSITPKEVKREENFAKFSVLLFIGAMITNYFLNDDQNYSATVTPQDNGTAYVTGSVPQQTNFTPAAVMVGSQQMTTSNKRAQWDNWKRWALDNKDFKKFKFDRIDKVHSHNQKILKKLERPSTQKEIQKLIFPNLTAEIKSYGGSSKFQELLKKYNGNLNAIEGPSVRKKYLGKIKPFKTFFKWASRIYKILYFGFLGLCLFYWVPQMLGMFFTLRWFLLLDVIFRRTLLLGLLYFGVAFFVRGMKALIVLSLRAYRSEKQKEIHSPFDFPKYYQT